MTGILSLGMGIHNAVSTYLSDCDDYFRTVANLEYVGSMYGKDRYYDPALEALLETCPMETLAEQPGVLSWEPNRSALGVMQDIRRTDFDVANLDAAVAFDRVKGEIRFNATRELRDIQISVYGA